MDENNDLTDMTLDKFTFYKEENWVVKINDAGIFFNKEKFSDHSPDDFAKEFIRILEKNFTVKFEEK